MADQKSAGDDLVMRRRRLRYRAWHRGTRELDLILGPFADAHAEAMPAIELARLEAVLETPDTDLMDWVLGATAPQPDADREMIDRIRQFQHARATQR